MSSNFEARVLLLLEEQNKRLAAVEGRSALPPSDSEVHGGDPTASLGRGFEPGEPSPNTFAKRTVTGGGGLNR